MSDGAKFLAILRLTEDSNAAPSGRRGAGCTDAACRDHGPSGSRERRKEKPWR
jgi:hypothetical protein